MPVHLLLVLQHKVAHCNSRHQVHFSLRMPYLPFRQ
nr:MAG TPA: hypothetical protein [Caudoviricetes sp.]